MNNSRRKDLSSIVVELNQLKERLEFISEEESESFHNLPESIQESEKGETMEENSDEIQEVSEEIESLIDRINEVIEK